MAFESDPRLLRSALHSAYDTVAFVTSHNGLGAGTATGQAADSYYERLDKIRSGQTRFPLQSSQHRPIARFVFGHLLGLDFQRQQMTHDKRWQGASEAYLTPDETTVYQSICAVIIFLFDLGLALESPFRLSEQALRRVPAFFGVQQVESDCEPISRSVSASFGVQEVVADVELIHSYSRCSESYFLRYYHPVCPSLKSALYTSLELGLAFLRRGILEPGLKSRFLVRIKCVTRCLAVFCCRGKLRR